jgi:hypothetical protein
MRGASNVVSKPSEECMQIKLPKACCELLIVATPQKVANPMLKSRAELLEPVFNPLARLSGFGTGRPIQESPMGLAMIGRAQVSPRHILENPHT